MTAVQPSEGMLGVVIEDVEYRGPELEGAKARALLRRIGPVMARVVVEGSPLAPAWLLQAEPGAEGILLQTFEGWTCAGEPITKAWLDALPNRRLIEPWLACIHAWGEMGFVSPSWRRHARSAEPTKATPTSG